jgi:hypothetical protein
MTGFRAPGELHESGTLQDENEGVMLGRADH